MKTQGDYRKRFPAQRRLIYWAEAIMLVLICTFLSAPRAQAQGCIVARSPEQVVPGIDANELSTQQSTYLQPGHFQISVEERHQFSYQHFVGDVYQEYRAQEKTQVENRINLVTTNLTYQWTPRFSVEIDMPLLFASRKTQDSPIEYQAQGLGDMILGVNGWIWNPTKPHRGNLSGGLGLLMPTGNDDVTNTVNTNTSGVGPPVIVTVPVDYSIQPGNGGWGLVGQWQGFYDLAHLIFYTDGDYIATQGGTNGIARGANLNPAKPLENDVAIADEYLMEGGIAFGIPRTRGLAGTFGFRDEGVPAKNLFPVSNDGFRRPGFAVTAGPGLEYFHDSTILTVGVYTAIHRDRTRSYPDDIYGTHGDAAFAKYVWLAGYAYRF